MINVKPGFVVKTWKKKVTGILGLGAISDDSGALSMSTNPNPKPKALTLNWNPKP